MASVITKKSNVSILKTYSASKRVQVHTVHFELPSQKNIKLLLTDFLNNKNKIPYYDFIFALPKTKLKATELLMIIRASRECVPFLTPKLSDFVECILSLDWLTHGSEVAEEYESFLMDLLIVHSKYCKTAIQKLISYWIAKETDKEDWPRGCPSEKMQETINFTQSIICKLLESIPMSFDLILEIIEKSFPYLTKPSYTICGYIHNLLALIDIKPMFQMYLITLIINKLITIDASTTRHDLEDDDTDEEIEPTDNLLNDKKINEINKKNSIGHTLDICLDKLMDYINNKFQLVKNEKGKLQLETLFNTFLITFEKILLPTQDTHHVQFILFYFCSLKKEFSDKFIKLLWFKICDPNNISVIRQAAIGYMASILARAKFVSLSLLKLMLKDMCLWAHQYIDRNDSIQPNSLKAHTVFYSVCQAIFYIIAFRSRQLTNDKKNIIYLQSLQLSSLVTSQLNPLKVCLPTIVQAFAGITRAHQIAYCQTIIEKNTRRKLTTVYLNDIKQDEYLESFFPFDPCLLKHTSLKINPIYFQYNNTNPSESRKRTYSEMDDSDDFIVDKQQKINDLSKDFDSKFSYGISAGFQPK